MKMPKKNFWMHVLNVILVALIVESFLCSILLVRVYAREDCYDRLEEAASQATTLMHNSLDYNQSQLEVLAELLATNNSNPDDILQNYMKNFCDTQFFDAVCVHRANGTVVSYGQHIHNVNTQSFDSEVAKAPYVSDVYKQGESVSQQFYYHAVPIVRNDQTVGMLYGYIPLNVLTRLVISAAYEGKCKIAIIDGDNGDFLMNSWRTGDQLGNLYDGHLDTLETKKGYSIVELRDNVRAGKSGYYVFRAEGKDIWYYTYYMPIGLNNWSMQFSIDEVTGFAKHNDIGLAMVGLTVVVIVLMIAHLLVLRFQTARTNKRDQDNLVKSQYMYNVQRALLNAHNDSDYIEQALQTVASQTQAETAMLLTFDRRTVSNAYYWPSSDKASAMNMVGRNIRDDFPVLFDILCTNNNVVYYHDDPSVELSEQAKGVFQMLDIRDLILVPIVDNTGFLKGALCVVNMAKTASCELLECVSYDFFMAITNVENHQIIKTMGEVDYLTQVKNRNSFEAELSSLAIADADSLWCVYVDVNGLHETNNTKGHKAGDKMLCAVADAIKKVFGEKYTYRLGGDEFVSFAFNYTQEDLYQHKKAIMAELIAKGYYVSIGFEGANKDTNGIFNIEKIVSHAESTMYAEKRAFYEQNKQSNRDSRTDRKD